MEKETADFNSSSVLADLLNRYVGRGKHISVEDLAEACKCSINAVYLAQRGTAPGFDLGWRMVKKLPVEAQNAFLGALGFHGARPIEGRPCYHEVHFELTRTGAYYGEAYRDGVIDHKEQRDLATKFLPRLMAAAARCVRAGAR